MLGTLRGSQRTATGPTTRRAGSNRSRPSARN